MWVPLKNFIYGSREPQILVIQTISPISLWKYQKLFFKECWNNLSTLREAMLKGKRQDYIPCDRCYSLINAYTFFVTDHMQKYKDLL